MENPSGFAERLARIETASETHTSQNAEILRRIDTIGTMSYRLDEHAAKHVAIDQKFRSVYERLDRQGSEISKAKGWIGAIGWVGGMLWAGLEFIRPFFFGHKG